MLLHMTSTQERFWGNRCQGNCGGMRSSRRKPVTQVDGCAGVLFTFAQGSPCMCVDDCVYDYHVIASNYVPGGNTLSSQCEPHLLTDERCIKQEKHCLHSQLFKSTIYKSTNTAACFKTEP